MEQIEFELVAFIGHICVCVRTAPMYVSELQAAFQTMVTGPPPAHDWHSPVSINWS